MNAIKEIVEKTTGDTRDLLDQLVSSLSDHIKKNRVLEQKIEYLAHDNGLLRKRLFGTSSEKAPDAPYQIASDLFDEFELCANEIEPQASAEEETEVTVKKRKGRKPLPKHLSRKEISHRIIPVFQYKIKNTYRKSDIR